MFLCWGGGGGKATQLATRPSEEHGLFSSAAAAPGLAVRADVLRLSGAADQAARGLASTAKVRCRAAHCSRGGALPPRPLPSPSPLRRHAGAPGRAHRVGAPPDQPTPRMRRPDSLPSAASGGRAGGRRGAGGGGGGGRGGRAGGGDQLRGDRQKVDVLGHGEARRQAAGPRQGWRRRRLSRRRLSRRCLCSAPPPLSLPLLLTAAPELPATAPSLLAAAASLLPSASPLPSASLLPLLLLPSPLLSPHPLPLLSPHPFLSSHRAPFLNSHRTPLLLSHRTHPPPLGPQVDPYGLLELEDRRWAATPEVPSPRGRASGVPCAAPLILPTPRDS